MSVFTHYMYIYVYTHHITLYIHISYVYHMYILWYSSATVHFTCQDSQAVHVQSPGPLQTSLRGRATSPEQRRRGAAGRLRCGATSGPGSHAGSHGMMVFHGKMMGKIWQKHRKLGMWLIILSEFVGYATKHWDTSKMGDTQNKVNNFMRRWWQTLGFLGTRFSVKIT